jgi:hypothetical protein
MKTSTNIHYRREDRPLVPISVFSGVQLVATAAFDEFILDLEATHRGEPLQFPDKYPFGGGGPRQSPTTSACWPGSCRAEALYCNQNVHLAVVKFHFDL